MERIEEIKKRRIACGLNQTEFAREVGVNRVNLVKIEGGKKKASEKLLVRMEHVLDRYDTKDELEILFDYVRIRFPTADVKEIIEDVLHIRMDYFAMENHAFYGYEAQYFLGDIVLMISKNDEEKGVLLELKGRGCRQFEAYLEVQGRTWFDFFELAQDKNVALKRIDIAINDRTGMLDIAELAEKCRNRECISKFRSFKNYQSGELIQAHEEDAEMMGNTLYLGSLKSEIYFCVYEKDYEQYVRNGIPISEAETKNRFEIRLKNNRAEYAMKDILKYKNVGETVFSIIHAYVRFLDVDAIKEKKDWKVNERWKWFVGDQEREVRLTTRPEPYTLERAMRWLHRQVAPTLKMVHELDEIRGTSELPDLVEYAILRGQHQKILEQQTALIGEMII